MTEPQPATPDAALTARITALPDAQAVRVLVLVLDEDRGGIDQLGLRKQEPELREAVTDPALSEYADPATAAPDDGDLARTTLLYLTDTQPRLAETIRWALDLPAGDGNERFDPLTLAIGGLIVLALQTDVTLAKDTHGKWRFRLHKQPMKDSTLGTLLGKLIIAFGGGQH